MSCLRRCLSNAARSSVARALVAASLCLVSSGAASALPDAGTAIENTAEARFFDTDSGYFVSQRSNTVRTIVQAQEALLLAPSLQMRVPLGGLVRLPHRLTNTGNTASEVQLVVGPEGAHPFELLELAIFHDTNGNGQPDPGEPQVAPGGRVGPLSPRASLDLVVTGRVPTTAISGQSTLVQLGATTLVQGVSARVVDTVTVGDGALLQLLKTASHTQATPGQVLRFTLTASNNGNRAATGVAVQVDGLDASLALLRDAVPVNTQLHALGPPGLAVGLYHLRGAPQHSYVSTPPPDLAEVDAVAFGWRDPIPPGQTVSRTLDVRVSANASSEIVNTAQLVFHDGVSGAPVTSDSNTVQVTVPQRPPTLEYFADADYTQVLRVLPAGGRFYVQADAAQCNLDPQKTETRQVTIRSTLTGDVELFLAIETGVNTGVFRIDPHVQSVDFGNQPPIHGDGLVSTGRDDKIIASLDGCGLTQIQITLLIDPFGVVYDSRSNLPVAGAVVTLIDVTGAGNGGQPGGAARVFEVDTATRAPSTVTTGVDGRYAFPLVPPSEYRLAVTAPAGYLFPSEMPPSLQPAGRLLHPQGSYGRDFPVNAQTGAVELDIPLDAIARSDLFIEKSAARQVVELGDFLDYTVRVRNVSDQLLGRVRVTDRLPAGFAYVRGSARLNGGTTRLNGSALPEPDGGVGPVLQFEIGSMPDQGVYSLTYRVRVGVGALQGDGINRVQASTPAPLQKTSNEASAAVQVLPGVFSDRGFLVGKVYADCKPEAAQGVGAHDGLGVPGVRLFLQDGSHVTTDRDGRYSLYGLAARTHVVKLDATTLGGLKPHVTTQRQAHDAASRFVDIQRGELHRADFVLEGCDASLYAMIAERVRLAETGRGEAEGLAAARFSTRPAAIGDPRSLPAAGRLGPTDAQGMPSPPTARPSVAQPVAPSAPGAISALLTEAQIAAIEDNHLEILNLKGGQALLQTQSSVVVKGRMGLHFRLSVNGVPQGDHRVGTCSTVADKMLQVCEYVGVDFVPGRNQIEVEQRDEQGRVRQSHMLVVAAPGRLAGLRLTPARLKPAADGKTALPVMIETVDADGVVIGARTPVTLDTVTSPAPRAGGQTALWQARDLNPDEPGVQIFVENGQAVIDLLSPGEAGEVVLQARSGTVSGQVAVSFQPDLRAMVAVGIIEGVLDLRRLDSSALQPARARDGFEQELRGLSQSFGGGRAHAEARAAVFLRGRIRGDMLLTLGFDSEKSQQERLFRDIQPDAYYPVYGDDSVRGFEAQSTGKLYVRVDHSRFYALLGDFNTQTPASGDIAERRLGQHARSLNGLQGQVRTPDGRTEAGGFASRGVSRLVVEELPALGISGPYRLAQSPFVENSETVEILTRDRDQPTRIVRTVVATRFVDYQIEPMTGRILFRAPVPSLDTDFNPNVIRVRYEVEQGGDAFWVVGAQVRHQLDDRLTVSGAVVQDDNPQDRLDLLSAQARLRLGERTTLDAEMAQAVHGLQKGGAARIEVRHDGPTLQWQAHAVRAGPGFDNPSAGVSPGQDERGARAAMRLDTDTVIKGELLRNANSTTQTTREGLQVALERQLSPELRAEIGLRRSLATDSASAATGGPASGHDDSTTVRAKLQAQMPGWGITSVFVEAEQDIEEAGRRLLALGGESRLGSGLRLYGRHELASTLGPRYGLSDTQQRNATVLGVSGEPFADAQAFGEYRARNALSGHEAEAAMGLRQRWTLGGGWSANAGLERVTTLAGSDASASTSFTSGLDYHSGREWRASGRLEWRVSPQSDSLLNTLSAAWRLEAGWTLLARNALSITRSADGGRRSEDWLQVGMAYRDAAHNRLNALLRVEYRGERAQAVGGTPTGRDAFIVSTQASQQWTPQTVLSGRHAIKWVRDRGSFGLDSRSRLQLLSARLSRDIGHDWDVSLHASVLAGHGVRQTGLGLELGRLLSKNLWLSGGFNFFGFRDRELVGQEHTNPGTYLRLRFKFDENSF